MTTRPIVYTVGLAVVAALAAAAAQTKRHRQERERKQRAKWVDEEKKKAAETLPSILRYFQELKLEYGCKVDEANKRRTTKYYQLARDAHVYDLCVGVRSYPRLRNRRETEMARIMKYWKLHLAGDTKSHRTVIAMCDSCTKDLLYQVRRDILEPLNYSTDITTSGVWIPEASILPASDMHVTIAIPWWWHTVRPNNMELSEELVARFRQALVMEFHHPFQVELERIVLLGGKALVALWRCVGERKTESGEVIFDRSGDSVDPLAKLRRDIVRCFTTTDAFESIGKEPLTYSHRFQNQQRNEKAVLSPPPVPTPDPVVRQNTIELKTPGLGDHDGFIHTTLARLPLDCLSMTDIELAPIHRLCREATATCCGHRLVISKFRFLETIGAGGDSNPCINPIFDETVDAPPRIEVDLDGTISENAGWTKNVDRHVTIGAPPTQSSDPPTLDEIFAAVQQE